MLTKIDVIRKAASGQAQKLKGGHQRPVLLDSFTAQAIMLVYDNLSPEIRKRYLEMPLAHMADIAWKVVKRRETN